MNRAEFIGNVCQKYTIALVARISGFSPFLLTQMRDNKREVSDFEYDVIVDSLDKIEQTYEPLKWVEKKDQLNRITQLKRKGYKNHEIAQKMRLSVGVVRNAYCRYCQ